MWTLGDRLAKAMRTAKISSGEMAAYLGVSRNTISNYIHDGSHPTRATVIAWSMRTGVPLAWLETGHLPGGGDGEGAEWWRPRQESNLRPRDYKVAGSILAIVA